MRCERGVPHYSTFCRDISFFLQIEILNQLRHPCIIQFYGVVVDRPGPAEHYIIAGISAALVIHYTCVH